MQQLHEQHPVSLAKARLWLRKLDGFYADENQGSHLPNLVCPAEADPVSLVLRTIASHLEDLDLRAIVTPDLFRAPVVLPRMKRLRVATGPGTSLGCATRTSIPADRPRCRGP